ncbi:glucosamine-6-phosphate deaminase [Candidimonas sp. SYP-B2681]|uniref:glucosamine-6-phosphate deaminase n=1 Tax=Candidimonas sp. SYP-B2681 TaxID=2497686 RepID=UPI000F883864|nr:glucosamine-6-phosphate deaminase [Candidimonas sp. SYP-B2681]RTZ41104.1 glucosamine-6-phosphate deaminase [Candidimonas sp. SYP-B2681]
MFHIFPDTSSIAEYVSAALIDKIKSKPGVVLGAATGGTMEPIYARFVQQAHQERLDLSQLISFNLDEYVGLGADHPKSYAAYMREHLFNYLGFNESRHHLPDGQAKNLEEHCVEYSAKVQQHGGIDLQLLGVGSNGHIGFNEPGTAFDSRCHVVQLSERTRIDNSRFFAKNAIVPASAITMGLQDIMDAREILLIATGESKAPILAEYYQNDITEAIPFTVLKRHPNVKIIVDEAAASLLPDSVCKRTIEAYV